MRLLLAALLALGGLGLPLRATESAPAAVAPVSAAPRFSKHARERMRQRKVSEAAVRALLSTTPFPYRHGGETKLGYHDPQTGLFVATTREGLVITVITGTTKRYIEGLKAKGP